MVVNREGRTQRGGVSSSSLTAGGPSCQKAIAPSFIPWDRSAWAVLISQEEQRPTIDGLFAWVERRQTSPRKARLPPGLGCSCSGGAVRAESELPGHPAKTSSAAGVRFGPPSPARLGSQAAALLQPRRRSSHFLWAPHSTSRPAAFHGEVGSWGGEAAGLDGLHFVRRGLHESMRPAED